jgi:hypothetical protein
LSAQFAGDVRATGIPRCTYISGRLESFHDPGHFVGKGWMKLEFDRIFMPDTELPVPAKLVGVRGYRVDREGKILGLGHAKRDAVEWFVPPLWPWKVLSLAARGPRPALDGETRFTLRLMEEVAVSPPCDLAAGDKSVNSIAAAEVDTVEATRGAAREVDQPFVSPTIRSSECSGRTD